VSPSSRWATITRARCSKPGVSRAGATTAWDSSVTAPISPLSGPCSCHTCSMRSTFARAGRPPVSPPKAGAVVCWGDNAHGQANPAFDASLTSAPTPWAVYDLRGAPPQFTPANVLRAATRNEVAGAARSLSLGYGHGCAADAAGGVKCRGDASHGQQGAGAAPEAFQVRAIVGLPSFHAGEIFSNVGRITRQHRHPSRSWPEQSGSCREHPTPVRTLVQIGAPVHQRHALTVFVQEPAHHLSAELRANCMLAMNSRPSSRRASASCSSCRAINRTRRAATRCRQLTSGRRARPATSRLPWPEKTGHELDILARHERPRRTPGLRRERGRSRDAWLTSPRADWTFRCAEYVPARPVWAHPALVSCA
jgi:hypothetical protein